MEKISIVFIAQGNYWSVIHSFQSLGFEIKEKKTEFLVEEAPIEFIKTIGDIETSGSYSFGIALGAGLSATNITASNAMVIMGGNVGINRLNPSSRLHVSTDEASNWAARFFNDGNNSSRYGIKIQGGYDNASGVNYMIHCYDGDGTHHGGLAIVNATVSVVQNSDRRLKENILSTEYNGLEILKNLEVVDYNYIKELNPEIIVLQMQKIYDYTKPGLINSAQDKKQMQLTIDFYSDARDKNITNYTLVLDDNYGLVFLRDDLSDILNCEL